LSVFAVVCIFALFGCNKNFPDYASEHEAASSDFVKVNELAKLQFAEIFKEFDDRIVVLFYTPFDVAYNIKPTYDLSHRSV
jgi:hypothetical protein